MPRPSRSVGTGSAERRPKTRTLTDTEAELWREVTRSVSRLATGLSSASATPADPAGPASPETPAAADPTGEGGPAQPAAKRPPAAPRHHHATVPDIDRRQRRKLARGTQPIEARLDLHGTTQEEARRRLGAFLADAQTRGLTTVLVITGKGRGEGGDRGILRRAVPHWLTTPGLNRMVAGFGTAHQTHGGDGAFYVRLRRADRRRPG